MSDLDLGMVGNCCISALVDRQARIVWSCFPRFDADPLFHSLLGGPTGNDDDGSFSVTLGGLASSRHAYRPNTAILETVLEAPGGTIQVVDFAPRFDWRGRPFRPQMLVRRIRPLSGSPRIRLGVRPRFDYGATAPRIAHGSNHIRFHGPRLTVRLTTDAPIDYVNAETEFTLDEEINCILGPDETLSEGISDTARDFEERTDDYWRSWSRRLAVPLEWQDAVIRAAITLKLCSYEPTGAVVAAMTTSIPEAPDSGRNWDYRYCWVRDAFFVTRALNSLSAVRTMENYFRWIMNIVARADGEHIQPVFGIGLDDDMSERIADQLPGYRGMGPVRIGNQAHEHLQHDTYGNLILGAAQAFFDRRLFIRVGREHFEQFEAVGERAVRYHDQPDAGMWELRSRARIHTSSSVMCWAACDRLAKIAAHLGLAARARHWRSRADAIKSTILERAWSFRRRAFVESFEGEHLDASVLLMSEVGFIDPRDERFVATVDRLEETLARGHYMLRYEAADDFGLPMTAFNVCAFWRLDALARIGRRDQAREIFAALLETRNSVGLMSEDSDPATGAPWGNFPQTYSMVGIVNGAVRLSRPWDSVI
jgi:GH15 family glucan-1,4-alpha-glucosidase